MVNKLRTGWFKDWPNQVWQPIRKLQPTPGSVLAELFPLLLIGTITTGALLGMRYLGALQPLELWVYDHMVRFRPSQLPDPRLLIVEITETDIRTTLKRWPPSDAVIANVLAELNRYQPAAIGLDLPRDIPYEPGHTQLVKQLQNPRLVVMTFASNKPVEAIAPPPNVAENRVGATNILLDPDDVVRRQLLYVSDAQTTHTSFSLLLARLYLQDRGIISSITTNNELKLNQTVFPALTKTTGGYQRINDAGYQILLQYRSETNVAQRVSLTQVLMGQISSEQVRGRVVLVGITAPSSRDRFRTPYYNSNSRFIPGVVLHAHMTSQILSAVLGQSIGQSQTIPLIWDWSELWEVIWIVWWTGLSIGLLWRVRQPLYLGLGFLLLLILLKATGLAMFAYQGWIPLAAPMLSLGLTTTAGLSYQRFQAFQHQQLALRLLGQQTSPDIATALWQHHTQLLQSGRLPGKKLIATIVFTDIRNFSTLAEIQSTESLMDWLNEYFEQMTQLVYQYQGIVNKFLGDGLMAVFGVPIASTTEVEIAAQARAAVNCALEMSRQLTQMNQRWQSQNLPVIQIRVGIFTGPVMVGSLGSKQRLEYAVIGDSANIASHLESCEKDRQVDDCRILITKETLNYLSLEYKVEAWGWLSLKGRAEPVEVYRVLQACLLEKE